jgi:hypothetical protein
LYGSCIPSELICTGIPPDVGEGVELISDARDGL